LQFFSARINLRRIFSFIGKLLLVFAVAMLLPAAVEGDASADAMAFLGSAAVTGLAGSLLALFAPAPREVLNFKESFLLTTLAWVITSLFSSLPFAFGTLGLGFTDAFFEAASGLTTTGATVLSGLDQMPRGILLWRALLQWIGGIGIIVLALAILPHLGIGGMHLFHTESSDRSTNPFPRIRSLMQAIFFVYLGLSLLSALAYLAAGMTAFDAVAHALTTIATGGYSTSDHSIGKFGAAVQGVAIVFMLLASLPMVLYVRAVRGDVQSIWKDGQVRLFFLVVGACVLLFTLWLWGAGRESLGGALLHVAFHVTSIISTTGYSTTDYSQWGTLAFETFFFLTFVGGCSGSIAGGIKMFRFEVMFDLIRIQLKRMVDPGLVVLPKYNQKPIKDETVHSVLVFIVLYLVLTSLLAVALSMLGLDFITSASASFSAMANVGPGLGEVIGPGHNYSTLPGAAKWVLAFGMFVGRLEIFTVLILFTPGFWRREAGAEEARPEPGTS